MTMYCPTCAFDEIRKYSKFSDDLLLVCLRGKRVYNLAGFSCVSCGALWFVAVNEEVERQLESETGVVEWE